LSIKQERDFQIHDKTDPMKFFRVTDNGEIIILETSQNQIKVSIIHF